MDNMQADALRRAREMHSSTQPPKKEERSAPARQREVDPRSDPVPSQSCGDSFPQEGALEKTLFADKEKMLILSLILILCTEEQSDPALTLALLYLII